MATRKENVTAQTETSKRKTEATDCAARPAAATKRIPQAPAPAALSFQPSAFSPQLVIREQPTHRLSQCEKLCQKNKIPRINNTNAGGCDRTIRGIRGRFVFRSLCLASALLLLFGFWGPMPAGAQAGPAGTQDLSKNPEWFPRFYRPYQRRSMPDPQLSNSPIVLQLVSGGKLRLSVADLRAAVRENNLDIMSARYAAAFADTDLLRARGGGAPRGGPGIQIPSALFAGAIGAGLGDAGGMGGFTTAGGITGGARQVFVRPRGSLDPSLLLNFSYDHNTVPLNTTRVAGIPTVTTDTTALQGRYVQAFVTGTSISISYNNQIQRSTQQFLLFSPAAVSTFSFQFTQQVLNGFGRAANKRFLDVAENDLGIARESLRVQVSSVLARAESLYWDVAAARESIRVAEASLTVARQLFENNRMREEIGRMSRIDVVTAESEVAARERDLALARANLQLREADLKNLLCKDMDAMLGAAEVEAIDPLPEPRDADIPQLGGALAQAMRERPEIRQVEGDIRNQEVAVKYADNLLKPTLTVFGVLGSAGLWGDRLIPASVGGAVVSLPGGLSSAMRQVWKFDYPEYAFGFTLSFPLQNGSARADSARARLERKEAVTALQQTRNRIGLEVRRALISLTQAKSQVETARTAAALSARTLAAEEERLMAGVTTSYDVIRRQRDLLSAQLAEVQARAGYARALVELGRTMGALDK